MSVFMETLKNVRCNIFGFFSWKKIQKINPIVFYIFQVSIIILPPTTYDVRDIWIAQNSVPREFGTFHRVNSLQSFHSFDNYR